MGCVGNEREERIQRNEVIISIGGDPRTLDPNLATDVVSAHAIHPFIRGVTVLDDEGRPKLEMARRIDVSPDGRTYDIHLRAGTKWTNGDPVTADDFIYAWKSRMLNPEFGAEYAYMLFYIEGAKAFFNGENKDPASVQAEAVAPDHLRVRLVAPAPFFPQLLAHHSYWPVCRRAVQADPDWSLRAETYVGNGPFIMAEYSPGDRITGVKNPDYWNAAGVAMNKIGFRFIEEETTERIAFEMGQIDGTHVAPRSDLEKLRRDGVLRVAPLIGTYFLNINMERPVFADARVRRALALAIDRDALVKNVTRAGERPAMSLVPPELYFDKDPPGPFFKDAQFEEAKRLMAEAGYPDGKGFPTLEYIYNTLESHRAIAQVLQENWKRIGVKMTIQNQEFKTLIDNRRGGNFDLARNGWIADFADPINFLELFQSFSENNDSHWKDAHFDELVRRAQLEPDPAKRVEILQEAESYLISVQPIVPLYFYSTPYLCAKELNGYVMNPMHSFDTASMKWASEPRGD